MGAEVSPRDASQIADWVDIHGVDAVRTALNAAARDGNASTTAVGIRLHAARRPGTSSEARGNGVVDV